MDEDQLFLRPADPPVVRRARSDLSAMVDDLDFIRRRLAQMPTRNALWRAAMLGMLAVQLPRSL
jgi:hypothetical protein